MPFGAMFGAVVFGVLCLGWGSRLLPEAAPAHGLATILWGALGLALPAGLLMRQNWARWLGAAAAALLAVLGIQLVLDRGEVVDHLVLLAALVTGILLIVPATGNLRRSSPSGAPTRRWVAGSLGIATLGLVVSLAALCLPAVLASSFPGAATADAAQAKAGGATRSRRGAEGTLQASGAPAPAPRGSEPSASSVAWASFGSGARRAKSEGRAMFVDFYTDWCGVCKMMDRKTFRDPEVVRALAELVPVRVDSEDETARDGFRGSDLAERHAIRGYPTLILFDSNGRELSRRAGYLEPRAFLAWLDSSLGARKATHASDPDALRAGR
jgi:thiol:disulfide interchange protein